MKKEKNVFLFLIVTMLSVPFLLLNPSGAYAESNNYFSVEALDEKGEANPQGFYQLTGLPKDEQGIKIRIYNDSDTEIIVKATVNPASTNQNGVPSYLGETVYDSSLVHRMDELVSLDETQLTIPENSSVIMEATVTFPSEEWTGDILGGIRFTKENETSPQSIVVQEVAYTIGILLNRINGQAVENRLNLTTINVNQRNYRNYIEANLQNSEASIIRELSISAKVFEAGNESPVYEYDAFDMRMAPNSNFDFAIPTGDAPLQSGEYLLEMVVKADEKEYRFEQNFSISSSDAQRLNTTAVNINQKVYVPIYRMLFFGVVICLSIFLIYKHKSRKKEAINERNK